MSAPLNPNDEPEITPEMIAAGCAELDGFVARDIAEGFINPSDVVVAIYRAMFLSLPRS